MRTIKLVVIGASGVGKTSLRNQYISGRFTTGYRATIGADFITKTLPHFANPEEKVTLQIWDTAGQERFSGLSSAFFRGADAVLLMFDVNQPQTLDALTKWWNEFRDRAPVPDEETDKFCCVFVGNKIDVPEAHSGDGVPAGLVAARDANGGAASGRVSESQAQQFMTELIPSPSYTPVLPITEDTNSLPKGDNLTANGQANHTPSPPRTNSIDIYHRRRRHSRSRSRSTLFRGGTIGTMTTTHTLSVYHTPSSSFFDAFESARSSPIPPSASTSTSSSHSSPLRSSSSQPSPLRSSSSQPFPVRSRSTSHSPVRSPQRKPSVSSTLSDAQTITPSFFARANGAATTGVDTDTDTDTDTTAASAPTSRSPAHTLPAPPSPPPECGPKLFFTSAKTGEGVADVFAYVARRVVARWEYEEAMDARTMHMAEGSLVETGTIRLRGMQGDQRQWCCST